MTKQREAQLRQNIALADKPWTASTCSKGCCTHFSRVGTHDRWKLEEWQRELRRAGLEP